MKKIKPWYKLAWCMKKDKAPRSTIKRGLIHNKKYPLDNVRNYLSKAKDILGKLSKSKADPEIQSYWSHERRSDRNRVAFQSSSSSARRSVVQQKQNGINHDITCPHCHEERLTETTTSFKQRDALKHQNLPCCSNVDKHTNDVNDTVQIHLEETKDSECPNGHSSHLAHKVYNF